MHSTLGQSLRPALTAWGDLVADGPHGPGVDFSETNRTRLCRTRADAFLNDPTEETFRELWGPEALSGYWSPNAGTLLGPPNAVENLQTVLSEMRSAAAFDHSWTDRLPGGATNWGIYELYARLQGGTEPIPSLEAQSVLGDLGVDVTNDPTAIADGIRQFEETYRSQVGHASGGTEYELPTTPRLTSSFASSRRSTGRRSPHNLLAPTRHYSGRSSVTGFIRVPPTRFAGRAPKT